MICDGPSVRSLPTDLMLAMAKKGPQTGVGSPFVWWYPCSIPTDRVLCHLMIDDLLCLQCVEWWPPISSAVWCIGRPTPGEVLSFPSLERSALPPICFFSKKQLNIEPTFVACGKRQSTSVYYVFCWYNTDSVFSYFLLELVAQRVLGALNKCMKQTSSRNRHK